VTGFYHTTAEAVKELRWWLGLFLGER